MTRVSSAFVGLCFVLSACSGQGNDNNGEGAQTPTSGSAGAVASGGDAPALGGAAALGGATSTSAGNGGTAGDSVAGAGTGGDPSEPGGAGGVAGASSTGGVAGSGSAGAAGGGPKAPIDYSIWRLELPIGNVSPTTVSPKMLLAGFSNAYFYTAPDGGQVFMDPEQGVAFSGSVHPRSEMRESLPDDTQASWASSGTNTMTVTGKVTLLSGGTKGSATIAQVFVADSNTLCELQYNGSGLKLFYEESKGNGESPVDLKTPIAMNTKYTFMVGYSKGLLTVSVNGKQVYSRTPSSAVSGKKFFFKFGNYDQTASPGTPSTTPYTQVEVYSVDVAHG
jgi:hypothetical protein